MMFARFGRVLREERPDVVHIHLNALLYAAPPALVRNTPVIVYTAHNFPELLIPHRLRTFYRTCFHHGVTPVSIAASLSPALRMEFGVDALPLIRNGIPVDDFRHPQMSRLSWRRRAGFGEDDFLFVCAARFSPQKNHDLLLRAFAADPLVSLHSHLLLAGDGVLRRPLERLAEQLDIASRVHFLGNRNDMPNLLNACDAFVLSSTQEANPLCVMEAMSAGLPVIATAVGGVPELLWPGIHGLLIEPESQDAFTQAMSKMMIDSEFRRECSVRAAERAVRKFDVRHMAGAYDALYRRLLAARRTPVFEEPQCLTQSGSRI